MFVFVALGDIEEFQTEFVRRACVETKGDFEGWPANVLFGGNGAWRSLDSVERKLSINSAGARFVAIL